MNDVEKIISQLEQRRSAIDRAVSALREIQGTSTSSRSEGSVANALPAAPKRRMSRGARKRIGDAARRRWAAKRAEEGPSGKSQAESPVAKKQSASRKGRISEEGRKRIADANRKRWAAKKAVEAGQKSAAGPARTPVQKKSA